VRGMKLNRMGKGEQIWSVYFVYVYDDRMVTTVEIFLRGGGA
jgi:hypothetical protein